ncbi:MAG: TIGR04282 family arsenosugar biosynthesis glycosyltransferase [Rhodospirillales bacterium]|jgi:uncharacterized protein
MNALPKHLVIFLKVPRLGTVKTRLARDIGHVPACAFYRTLTATILNRFETDKRWQRWIAITPDHEMLPRQLCRGTWNIIAQGRGNLGARMNRIMQCLPPGPVAIIGSDIPGIMPQHISNAFKRLGNDDAVFGPATDGGYWLAGLKRRPVIPEIFNNVRWSSEHTLADTLANFKHGQRIALLEELEDVDYGPAFQRWRNSQQL